MLISILSLPLYAQLVLVFLLGLLIGSFLNVVIYRLPLMMEQSWRRECAELDGCTPDVTEQISLFFPPSACRHCKAPVRPWQNIPVLSFLFQRGRCSSCRTAISWQYPLIELATAVIFSLLLLHSGLGLGWLMACILFASLLVLSMIDAQTKLLPDDLTLPLMWLGLIYASIGGTISLPDALWGSIAGYLSLWFVYWIFKLATGKDGMGYGDFKLLAALGAWLGWQMLPLVIILSSLLGTIFGIGAILLRRHHYGHGMPFGPFLAISGAISYLFGGMILQWYIHV